MRGIGGALLVLFTVAAGGLASPAPPPRGGEYDTIEWRTADSAVVVTGQIWTIVHNDAQDGPFDKWDTVSFQTSETLKGEIPNLIQFRIHPDPHLDKWEHSHVPLLVFLSKSRRFHSRSASLFEYAPHTGNAAGSILDLTANSGDAILTEHDGFVMGPASILAHARIAVQETKDPKYTSRLTGVVLIDGLGGPGHYYVEPTTEPAYGPVARFDSKAEYDGRKIAAVQGNFIKLWDAASGKLIKTLGPSGDPMLSEAMGPDGVAIIGASGSVPWPGSPKDNRIRVWDQTTGVLTNQTATHGPISSIAFVDEYVAGGGRIVTTSSEDYSGEGQWRERLWDVWNLDDYMIFPGMHPRISPDGSMVLTIDPKGWVGVWDEDTYQQLCTIRGEGGGYNDFRSAEFSPFGDRVVTTSRYSEGLGYATSMDVWDAQTGKKIYSVKGSRLSDAKYTNDGQLIVTGSLDGLIGVYEAEDGELLRSIKVQGEVCDCVISPDSRHALVRCGPSSYTAKADKAGLFDLVSGRELMHMDGDVSGFVGFSRDGKSLFGFGPGMKTGTVWEAESGVVRRKLVLQ